MTDPHWTSYVGMATGILGAILGVISYRRSGQTKKLDLRLALRNALTKAQHDLDGLAELLPYANKSRLAVFSATGRNGSGAMNIWKDEYAKDQERLQAITVPNADAGIAALAAEALETRIAEVFKIQMKIDALRDKYRAVVASDDAERARLADYHNRLGQRG